MGVTPSITCCASAQKGTFGYRPPPTSDPLARTVDGGGGWACGRSASPPLCRLPARMPLRILACRCCPLLGAPRDFAGLNISNPSGRQWQVAHSWGGPDTDKAARQVPVHTLCSLWQVVFRERGAGVLGAPPGCSPGCWLLQCSVL